MNRKEIHKVLEDMQLPYTHPIDAARGYWSIPGRNIIVRVSFDLDKIQTVVSIVKHKPPVEDYTAEEGIAEIQKIIYGQFDEIFGQLWGAEGWMTAYTRHITEEYGIFTRNLERKLLLGT